jgi:hypothetical protein
LQLQAQAPESWFSSYATAVSTGVPEQFIGEWSLDLNACGKGASESNLTITSSSIMLYASGGPVESVEVHGEDQVTIAANFHGEDGSTWLQSMTLRLSAAGTRLERDDSDAVYQRCADSASSIASTPGALASYRERSGSKLPGAER